MTGRINFLLVSHLALLLCAALVVISSAGGQRAVAGTVTVMSQNLYQGFDAEKFLADVSANPANVVALTTAAYAQVLANDFAARADAIALAVDLHRPALIGLQEVSLYRSAPFDGPGSPHATNVEIDYLDKLLDALSARGLNYAAVASVQNTDAEFPRLIGFDASNNPILQDIRLTDRDVILARTDLTPSQLEVSNPQSGNYSADFSSLGITFSNGWTAVDVEAEGTGLRFVSTHLALSPAAIQEQQAAELVAGLANTSLPTILVGDFNSHADGSGTTFYANLVAAGFSDAWSAIHPDDPGYTCCQAANLLNAPSQLSERIDFALFRNGPVAIDALIVGAAQSDRTPTGLGPSDHAGIVATLTIVPEPGTLLLVCFGGVALVLRRRSKRVPRIAAALFALVTFAAARADIYEWEYINPANPDLGKQQSTTLTPDGAGAYALPGANLSNHNLTTAYLIAADLSPNLLYDEYYNLIFYARSNFTSTNFSQADLSHAELNAATLTGANLSGAEVRNANFDRFDQYGQSFTQGYGTGLTLAQLTSTASYAAHDLRGISLGMNDLTGANFSGFNLAEARFVNADLTNVNFSGANLTGATITGTLTDMDLNGAEVRGAWLWGVTKAQLYSTASYQAGDLTGIYLYTDQSNWNFAGKDLSQAQFQSSVNLANSNVTGANLTGAYLSYINFQNANFSDANLTGANFSQSRLTGANLAGADVRGANFHRDDYFYPGSGLTATQLVGTASYQSQDLTGVKLSFNNLTGVNFSDHKLTNVDFRGASLEGANLTGADVRGASFERYVSLPLSVGGISATQLYSTASYLAHDLSGINLAGTNLAGANLSGQNLMEAVFESVEGYGTNLSGAKFSQANLSRARLGASTLAGAILIEAKLTQMNLQPTDLTNADLMRADLSNSNMAGYVIIEPGGPDGGGLYVNYLGTNLAGSNLSGANLANADFSGTLDFYGGPFPGANLTDTNLNAADACEAKFLYATLTRANLSNLIQSDGHVAGLNLTAGETLVVRDYDGNPTTSAGPLPIVVDRHLAMDSTGKLRMEFEADAWDSTITFAPGISVHRGGTLELTFALDVDPATQIGRTFDVFGWTGVSPTGAFTVESPYAWDLTQLYTTGEVTLTALAAHGGDFDGDGDVDGRDFLLWQRNPGVGDLADWQANFGNGSLTAESTAIPEPSGVLLAVFGMMFAAKRSVCGWTSTRPQI